MNCSAHLLKVWHFHAISLSHVEMYRELRRSSREVNVGVSLTLELMIAIVEDEIRNVTQYILF